MIAVALAATSLAACGTDDCSEGPGAVGAVASAERWLALVPTSFDGVDLGDAEGTKTVRIEAAPVDRAGRSGPARMHVIAIHTSQLPDIDEALEDGATVYLALSSGLEREFVPIDSFGS